MKVVCNYTLALEDIEDPAIHVSLTQTFDNGLERIAQDHSSSWTPEANVDLNMAKLNLYAMAFISTEESQIEADIVAKRQGFIFPRPGLRSERFCFYKNYEPKK
jgi:hypothetical protein